MEKKGDTRRVNLMLVVEVNKKKQRNVSFLRRQNLTRGEEGRPCFYLRVTKKKRLLLGGLRGGFLDNQEGKRILTTSLGMEKSMKGQTLKKKGETF